MTTGAIALATGSARRPGRGARSPARREWREDHPYRYGYYAPPRVYYTQPRVYYALHRLLRAAALLLRRMTVHIPHPRKWMGYTRSVRSVFEQGRAEITLGEARMTITITLPAISGREPTSMPAARAAPEEMPTGNPSTRALSRAVSIAVVLEMRMTSSIQSGIQNWRDEARAYALNLVGPGTPPDRTGLSSGSTATALNDGLRAFSTSATPVSVPPVPTPEIRTSTRPSVSCQISRRGAPVNRWVRRVGELAAA